MTSEESQRVATSLILFIKSLSFGHKNNRLRRNNSSEKRIVQSMHLVSVMHSIPVYSAFLFYLKSFANSRCPLFSIVLNGYFQLM